MWMLIAGYFVSIIFEHFIIILYTNSSTVQNMSVNIIIIGWFLQEHVKQNFNITSGKRFMIQQDFRNRFITQILKIFRNSVFWVHLITILELGTFIIYLLFYLNLLYSICAPQTILTKNSRILGFKIQNQNIFSFLFFGFILKFLIFNVYSWFDFFFVFRPFIFIFLTIYLLFFLIWGSYLFYLFFLIKFFRKFALLIKFFYFKYCFCIICLCSFNIFIVHYINIQNFSTNNFLKEILIKMVLFYFNYF